MNILISGYYGFGNAGDELILKSIISDIRNKYPQIDITVLSSNPTATNLCCKVKSCDRFNPVKIIKSIRDCDILLLGGGGLFQDNTSSLSLYYYLSLIILAKIFFKRVIIYAVGVNNLKPLNRIITSKIINLCDRISVREDFSYSQLKRWGCLTNKIIITADPVFKYDIEIAPPSIRQKPIIGLILKASNDNYRHIEKFAIISDLINQRLNSELVFIPFHSQYDTPFILTIMNLMKTTSRLVRWNTPEDIFEVFSELDLVISQRLHGLIIASLFNLPVIGISKDIKIESFISEIGQKNIIDFEKSNIYSIIATIIDVWTWREEFRNRYKNIIPLLKLRAKKNSEILFDLIERTLIKDKDIKK